MAKSASAATSVGSMAGDEKISPTRDPREIFDILTAVVWEMDPATWVFTYVSKYAETLLGFPVENWSRPGFWADRIHPDDREPTVDSCRESIEAGKNHFLEYRMIAADGRVVWVRDAVRVTVASDGVPALVSGILFDISHLKLAEQSWRQSEQRFTRFAEASTECVIIHDDGKILEVNDACTRMLGYTTEELTGMMAPMLTTPDDRPRLMAHMASGSDAPLSGKAMRKDGTTLEVDVIGRSITVLGEAVRVVTVRDVSKRISAERALVSAELDIKTIFDQVGDAIVLTDPELRLVRVNRSAVLLSGMSESELLGRSLAEFIDPRDLEASPMRLHTLPAGAEIRTERNLRSPAGEEMIADIFARRLSDGRLVVTIHDVTENRRVAASLRESEVLFQKAFQTSRDAVILFRISDEKVLDVNEAWIATTGIKREDAIGHSQLEFEVWGDESQRIEFHRQLSEHGVVRAFPFSFFDEHGDTRYGELSAEVITMNGEACALVIGRDTTDQIRLERHLRQTQKLEAIGGVAGGIAHDFNNILTAIRAFSELALDTLAHNNPAREDVVEILKAADRAIILTRQLLTFSRQEVQHVRTFDVNEVIADLAPMLRRLIGDRLTLSFDLAAARLLVSADPGQIEQVLVNLVINARDATRPGGSIVVSTAPSTNSGAEGGRPELPEGKLVEITVSDTGSGIDDATRERMFEPFFTTKTVGRGTGLGLSTVYGIVKQSSGAIEVDSEMGKGTTFRILLPMVENEAIG